jgi:3-phenylpropionate/trans-cinnamate dioxygenase ferredoxin component
LSDSNFIKVATTTEVQPDKIIKVQVKDEEVLLANIGGKYYAIANKCPHMHGDLSSGKLENEEVTCPRHGAKFNIKTGKAMGKPKMGLLHPNVKDAQVFEVKVEGQDILLRK